MGSEDAARDTALVLVLDDLHAADAPTLKLFEFVAGNVVRCPVLLVGTYRDVEVGKGDPLSDVVNRMPGETTRIELRGLDEANVAEVILRTVDVKPSATFTITVNAVNDAPSVTRAGASSVAPTGSTSIAARVAEVGGDAADYASGEIVGLKHAGAILRA